MTRIEKDVVLCRGCCCGTVAKHPNVDHDAQRAALQAGADAAVDRVRVRVVACLSECERSNVVLVRDLSFPRRPRDTWLGAVLTPSATADVAAWVRDGGPLPTGLVDHVFTPDRRAAW